jgi:excisionase family DNA binding protein
MLYKDVMGNESLLTTSEVAARLNISLRRVRQLIEAGRLPSKQFGRDHLVKESDLKLVENRKPGRPRKEHTKKSKGASKKESNSSKRF